MSDSQPDRDPIEERSDGPIQPRDVASAARSCFAILLLLAALIVVIGLYLLIGWVF